MKKISLISTLIFGIFMGISVVSFAEGKVCPEKSVCKICKAKCKLNPVQCPEDCSKCEGCLGQFEQ